MPPPVASARAVTASSSVAGSRSRITRSASCWSQSERPKFPRQRLRKKAPYCAHHGPAQTELPPDALDVLRRRAHRRHEDGGIARQDPEDREREHAHAPEREHRQEETAQQEAEGHDEGSGSGLATSMSTIGRTLAQVARQSQGGCRRRASPAYLGTRCSRAPCLVYAVVPFVAMLLAIAVCPLWVPHWWESNRNKLVLACVLGLPVVGLYAARHPHVLLETAEEYVSFMLLLLGAVRHRGRHPPAAATCEATPLVNTTFLAAGSVLASFLGTTGASMLLIRPVLQTNRQRTRITHTVVFFIFLVSNVGGLLTPLGDPPLFLGYLRGRPLHLDLPPPAALAVHRGPAAARRTSSGTRWRTDGSRPGPSSGTRRERRPLRLAGDAELRLARRRRARPSRSSTRPGGRR